MNIYRCACGNPVYFENDQCLACGRRLGFLPERLTQAAIEPLPGGNDLWRAHTPEGEMGEYHRCRNYSEQNVCNWMVVSDNGERYCVACRMNRIIPNLDRPGNRDKWLNVEREKRRVIYDLLRLGLPFLAKRDDPHTGLAFAFMEDQQPTQEFVDSSWSGGKVFTGHAKGLITINIIEADDAAREALRQQLNEASRTLLGHFRHEIGHYFWDRLILEGGRLAGFREVFGDERQDYQSSLRRHYQQGPPANWQQHYISAYAAAHPWEDWAECWGHYLQITDALETAHALDMGVSLPRDFDELIRVWSRVSININLMNRSMGMRDAYPYVLNDSVVAKLRYIHEVVEAERSA